jgi:serine/threonine protein kinase
VTREAPRTLGRFELLGVLGEGAFGTVYRARDPRLERVVALKIPRAGSLPSGQETDLFLREARAAARLRHPNIVPVFEAGQIDDCCYIASALIEGQTVRSAVKVV